MQNIYGVVGKGGEHFDVGLTERGAKNYATRHGYTEVSRRYSCGYNVEVVAKKVGNKWIKVC